MENDTINISKLNRIYKTKKDLYTNERNNIIKLLSIILEMTPENMSFYLYHIENDLEKQKQIIALEPQIKKYFKCGTWSYFAKNTKKGYLSLIRSIFKDMGFSITRNNTTLSINSELVNTQLYIIKKI